MTTKQRARAEEAIARGLAFLARTQLPSGDLPTLRWRSADPSATTYEPAMFNPALIVASISHIAAAEPIVARAADFVESQMLRFGVWKYSPTHGGGYPPDLDDTSLACLALRLAGRVVPNNDHAFMTNRRGDGLFYTWLSPRLRWFLDPRMWLIAAARWRHPIIHYRAFNPLRTSARRSNVDTAVNANILFYLGRRPETEPVIELLLRVLREGSEATCDHWYNDPFVIWRFFSRALRRAGVDARELLVARVRGAKPRTPLQQALAASVLLEWNEPADELVEAVIAAQLDSGAWPCEVIYGGDGLVWGSESLTTGFCLEAISRWLDA